MQTPHTTIISGCTNVPQVPTNLNGKTSSDRKKNIFRPEPEDEYLQTGTGRITSAHRTKVIFRPEAEYIQTGRTISSDRKQNIFRPEEQYLQTGSLLT